MITNKFHDKFVLILIDNVLHRTFLLQIFVKICRRSSDRRRRSSDKKNRNDALRRSLKNKTI